MECVMNRFSLVILCMLATSHIACPMGGSTIGWTQRIKNSLNSIYTRALSYCSLKKQQQPLQRNTQVSEMLDAQSNGTQKRHEQIRMMPWAASLKNIPCKAANPHEDDIKNPVIIPKRIPFVKQPAHLIECNDPEIAKNFVDFHAKEYARMLEASDYIITNHTRAFGTPIKHAGLSITRRSIELYKEHKLARYAYDKTTKIQKIAINGMCKNVNQMVVCQHEEHLSHPTVYVTVKDNDRQTLEKAEVTFTCDGTNLFIKIDNADHYDFELHLPRRMAKPEIKFITQQSEPLQVIKQ